jgi:hypothetical protein
MLRVGVSPRWEQWKERFARETGTREPLGTDFTRDSLGPTFFPFIAGLAPALVTLTGLPAPPLSLGRLDTRLDVTQVTTQVTLDYGVTSRLGIGVLIPYVKNRVYVTPIANENGIGATLGFNPAQSFAGARQQNELVVTNLATATTTLSNELARCLGLSDPTCAAINADRAGATALVQTAGQVSTALGVVYGTPSIAGSLYSPVAGGALQTAVDARLTTLNNQFRGFLGAPPGGEWISGRPVGAPPIAAADLERLIADTPSGIVARPLGDYEHSHVGDIEVGAKFILLDTFGPQATAPLPRAGALRVAAAGFYRLATAQVDLPNDFADVGTGDRQPDIEVRGFGDLALSPRLWISSVARLAIQRPDRLVRRITDNPGDPFPELVRELDVMRDLGDAIEFEVTPRYAPNDEFSLSVQYRYRSKGADSYSGSFQVNSADGTPLSLDAATLGGATEQSEQRLGFAVTYSTVHGYTRRTARWPLELSFMHTQVMSGKGVPRMWMNGIGFRLYRPIAGNSLRGPGTGDRGRPAR